MKKKVFVREITNVCSLCPNYDYQWDSMGNNGKQICTASEIGPGEFEIDGYQNGFRIVPQDFQGRTYNPISPIPDWCPLPDA